MRKKLNKKSAIILLVILIVLAIAITAYLILRNDDGDKNHTIVATKVIDDEDESVKKIRCKIRIQDYTIENVEKEITFDSEEQAQLEYERYQIINQYEGKNLNVQIQKKKLIILMTEEQFREDIEYDEAKNIRLIDSTGEQKEIMDQEEIINVLVKQGYTIK